MSAPSTKQRAKQFAENFLLKLVDPLDAKKEDDMTTKPLSKPSMQPTESPHSTQTLLQSFANLKVASDSMPNINSGPLDSFVGGFHPVFVSPHGGRPPLHQFSSTPAPSMPVPFGSPPAKQQSLTMQMAIHPDSEQRTSRPHSTSHFPPFSESELNELRPVITPTKPKPKLNVPAPQTPGKVSTSNASAPPTPSNGQNQLQCAGMTKAGKRCTRIVKTASALSTMIGENDDSENPPLERFCFQHTKELLGPSGCYSRKNGEWVEFNDWIPGYLQIETQLSLRIEMERMRSQSDVDGYIYTFEIREHESKTIKLKVGRAVNLVKRIDQWDKQCGSKEQVLRGYYPNPEVRGENMELSLMKGRVKAGEKAPCCHRLERLVHLELADLVSTCIYLDPAWPMIEIAETTFSPASPTKTGNKKLKTEPCADCGTTHKEIFEFQRWEGCANQWERIVKPVIERWGTFVELYV